MAQTDLFRKYKSLFSTTLSAGIGTGTGETITPASVSGLPTGTEITLTIDRVDSSGVETPTKLERITGTISGGNLINYTRGIDSTTEQAHSSGAVVEMVWSADDWNDAVDGILVGHTQTGAHGLGVISASSVAASAINASSINASAVIAGHIAASAITSGRIAASAVVSGNLAASAIVAGNLNASAIVLGNLAASSVSQGNLNFSINALSSKIIASTRDMTAATGNVSYTGVGFQPTSIIAFANISATSNTSWGMSDSTGTARNINGIGSGTVQYINSTLIYLPVDTSNNQSAVIATYDVDGFTLTWTKTASPTGTATLAFLCFK